MHDHDAIVDAEARLRTAMLTSDVAALDDLLDDTLCFTDHAGNRLSKDQDLAVHRSGLLRIETIDAMAPPVIRVRGDSATVCLTADLRGLYNGAAFSGRFAYSRVWHRDARGWRVVLAHCSAPPA
ncbi:MAG: nuclear transport factor 2 family protein [Sphingopyxis sp.]|uniref:nuclear transport factor 2 family protein n=1 Tax=Sphingopyxis sp. TaxID=1908224 RepID=UPI002AB9592C|nr:nuclear transport factor 2 family protein [Sphingopyxis sp.]MDZ3830789.1 nuclear transport factor 2 family protein [Sphingopyxis sp.]